VVAGGGVAVAGGGVVVAGGVVVVADTGVSVRGESIVTVSLASLQAPATGLLLASPLYDATHLYVPACVGV